MSQQARVLSVEVLDDLRAALVRFRQEASSALSSAALVVERAEMWLDEQARYWKNEIRKREQAVSEARLELQRRKLTEILGRPADTTEQEKALRLAQARLEEAERKLRAVRVWQVQWPRAVNEYRPSAQHLTDFLEVELPQALAWLQGRIEALQAYLASRPPTAAASTSSDSSPDSLTPPSQLA